MSTFIAKHFDTLEYVKQAKKLGTNEDLAEFQAKQIEKAIELVITQIEEKELASKKDLEYSLEKTKLELQKEIISSRNLVIVWVAGLLISSGLLQHFLK